ncbi:MAG: DUF58 domain-containing protein [Armatimonadota bacterium]
MTSLKTITVWLFAIFALMASVILHFGSMFIMALALITVPVISYLIGRTSVREISCIRDAPQYAHEDEAVKVTVRIKTDKGILGSIEIDDQLPKWLVRQPSITQEPNDNIVGEANMVYSVIGEKRGEYQIGPLKMVISDPLGFYRFSVFHPLKSRIIILPRPLDIPELQIKPTGQTGEHQYEGSGSKGSGLDFHSVREYHSGDELRRVHWPSTARHGKLNVIEFEHTKVEDAVIAVDLQLGTELGEGRFTTLEYAVSIAAALSEQALSLGSTVRLICQGVTGPASRPAKGLSHWYSVLEALAKVEAKSLTPIGETIAQQFDLFSENAALICLGSSIGSDFLAYADLLMRRGTKVQFILIQLTEQIPDDVMEGISGLAAIGGSIIVVECSTTAIEGRITYEYSGQ